MRFQEIHQISREEGLVLIESNEPEKVCDVLVRLAYHDSDGEWVQDLCLRLSNHSSKDVRGAVATCFGHLARIHRGLDQTKAIAALSDMREDEEIAGRVEDALDDIRTFTDGGGKA